MIDLRYDVLAVGGYQSTALVRLGGHHEAARYAGTALHVVRVRRTELDVVAALVAAMANVVGRHRTDHRTRLHELRSIVILGGLSHDGLQLLFLGLVEAGQIGRFDDVAQRDVRFVLLWEAEERVAINETLA